MCGRCLTLVSLHLQNVNQPVFTFINFYAIVLGWKLGKVRSITPNYWGYKGAH